MLFSQLNPHPFHHRLNRLLVPVASADTDIEVIRAAATALGDKGFLRRFDLDMQLDGMRFTFSR